MHDGKNVWQINRSEIDSEIEISEMDNEIEIVKKIEKINNIFLIFSLFFYFTVL